QSPRARSGGSRKTPEQPPTTAKEFVPYAVRRWPRREGEGAGEYVDRLLRHTPHKWSRNRIQNLLSELKPSQGKLHRIALNASRRVGRFENRYSSCFDFMGSHAFPKWEAAVGSCSVKAAIMKTASRQIPASIRDLTPLELARKIPVAEAAAFNGIHVQTFLKRYRHLVCRIGERRLFVTVRDAIMLPPAPDTS